MMLSDKWVQIGITFCPLPERLWGAGRVVVDEAIRRGAGPKAAPSFIDQTVAEVCAELVQPNQFLHA